MISVAALLAEFGFDAVGQAEAIGGDAAKALLRAQVDAAIAAGVFGVPSFVAGGELFWGVDRLPMLERWVATGAW